MQQRSGVGRKSWRGGVDSASARGRAELKSVVGSVELKNVMSSAEVKSVVGRAELKLAEAVQAFGFDFRDKIVLDIGSSTGGFTEFALSQGVRKVIAIEKGTQQMKVPLRFDARVELHEKTDIFEVTTSGRTTRDVGKRSSDGQNKNQLEVITPDVVLADVSFVSLEKVLRHVRIAIAQRKTEFLVMLKPQFEAQPSQLNHGIVKNESMRRDIIRGFELWLRRNGFLIIKKRDNELTGKNGNRERFYWLRLEVQHDMIEKRTDWRQNGKTSETRYARNRS